ncbi:MAG: sensor histidine kinase [Nitriliruptoraceae bacterium]
MEQTRRTILRGLAAFRWFAWLWMAAVLWLARGSLVAPRTATVLVLTAGAVTFGLTWQLARDPAPLLRGPVVGLEVGTAVALQLADGFVYAAPHVFTTRQPLGVAWPLAGILVSGVAFGPLVGAVTGVLLGVARAVSSLANVVPATEPWIGPLDPEQGLSLVTTTVLYALAGGIAGYATRLLVRTEHRLRTAERTVAQLEARAEVARRLHDGVLQTLALVERRADDPELARLARDQERELRRELLEDRLGRPAASGTGPPPGSGPASGAATASPEAGAKPVPAGLVLSTLRHVADRAEDRFGVRTEVLVPDDLPALTPAVVGALEGAVTEALTNVGKHADASRVVIYAEPQDAEVFVSVRDDGVGFDVARVAEGLGLRGSVRQRLVGIGGRSEVRSVPGSGTEVQLWVPVAS